MARKIQPTDDRTAEKADARRMFINITTPSASPYALGPTTHGYPNTPDGRAEARRDAADQYDVDVEDVEVWPADPREYGRGR